MAQMVLTERLERLGLSGLQDQQELRAAMVQQELESQVQLEQQGQLAPQEVTA
jgi:hypothetical protein